MRKYLNKENATKVLSFFYKLGVVTAGVTATVEPVSAIITGVITAAAAISSSVKDKNLKALSPIINILALNIGKAKNNVKDNV